MHPLYYIHNFIGCTLKLCHVNRQIISMSAIACHKSGETEEVHGLQLVRVDVSKRLVHQLQEELHVVRI